LPVIRDRLLSCKCFGDVSGVLDCA
jgi:hypothetical protein